MHKIYVKRTLQKSELWISLSLGAVIIGFGLLPFAWIGWGFLTGRPMDQEEAREFMGTSAGLTRPKLVIGG